MNEKIRNKIFGLLLFAVFYIAAYVIGYFSAFYIDELILRLFIFDIVATLVIYLLSLPIKNSSLYDAYWSLTPFVMATYLLVVSENLNVYHFIAYAVFAVWSFRLTINWVITFQDIKWVDWRYRQIKENNNTIRNLTGEYKKIEPDCREGVRAQLERMKELCKERNNLYEKQNDLKGQKWKIEKSLER